MHVIVDGYNVLMAMPEFYKGPGGRDMPEGRKMLLERMWRYARATGERVTVIFDGRGRREERAGSVGSIKAFFSPDADEKIIEMVSGMRGAARVITSDRKLRQEIRRLGGRCDGPMRFFGEVREAIGRGKDKEKPGELSEAEVREWLEAFGCKGDKG